MQQEGWRGVTKWPWCGRWDGIHGGGFSWPQSPEDFQPVSAESFGRLLFWPGNSSVALSLLSGDTVTDFL